MLHEGKTLRARFLRENLQQQNYPVMKSTTDKARLRALYARYQRGLMSYEGLPLHELKLYAAQRDLPLIVDKKATVKVLKAQLEQADDETTFGRFSDLPPEIRQIIYDLHFKYINTRSLGSSKYQPPITLVSRQIRHESLPLFYKCSEFTVSTSNNLNVQQSFNKALGTRARAFIGATSTQDFAHIRMMRIIFLDLSIDLRMDLKNKETPLKMSWHCQLEYPEDYQAYQKLNERLLEELHKIGSHIAAREGPLKLRKSDLELLHETSWEIIRNGLTELT